MLVNGENLKNRLLSKLQSRACARARARASARPFPLNFKREKIKGGATIFSQLQHYIVLIFLNS